MNTSLIQINIQELNDHISQHILLKVLKEYICCAMNLALYDCRNDTWSSSEGGTFSEVLLWLLRAQPKEGDEHCKRRKISSGARVSSCAPSSLGQHASDTSGEQSTDLECINDVPSLTCSYCPWKNLCTGPETDWKQLWELCIFICEMRGFGVHDLHFTHQG